MLAALAPSKVSARSHCSSHSGRRTFITRAARLWQMSRGLAGRRIDEPQLRNAAVLAAIGPIVPLGDDLLVV